MKNILIKMILITLVFSAAAFGQSEVESKPKKDSESSILEAQALEYFKAVLDEDYKTAAKYVHPNVVKDLGNNEMAILLLKLGVDALREGGMELFSVEIMGVETIDDKETGVSTFVNHTTVFRTTEGDAEFEGKMRVYKFEEKNYFINSDGMIIDSFGIKEFDEEEEEPEDADPR